MKTRRMNPSLNIPIIPLVSLKHAAVSGFVSLAEFHGRFVRVNENAALKEKDVHKWFQNRGLGVIMVMNYCQLGQNQKQVQTGFSCNSHVFW